MRPKSENGSMETEKYMEKITGKYAQAEIFADDAEDYAKAQIEMICNNEVSDGCIVRIMPDVHPGQAGPIGLTMTVGRRIIPQLLGIDIGCGIVCIQLREKRMELQKLDKVIRERIPSGFKIRQKSHHRAEVFELQELRCFKHVSREKAVLSLGTLGGGNHFIEVDRDEEGNLYVVIHSGSRHLGKEVTDYYVKAGAALLKERGTETPYPLTWLEGELMEDYLHDLLTVQRYAQLNREIMAEEIMKGMKLKAQEARSSVHNYFDASEGMRILRKGAISARRGEQIVIPVNMRDGIILGTGKGNPEWNFSAPHGSGRKIQRDEVKERYTVAAFRKEMKGIYSSCIAADTLDEAPFAYRSIEDIREKIRDTAEIEKILKPVYNFKAGDKR